MKGQIVKMAVAMLLVFGVSAAGAATQKTTNPPKVTKATKPQVQTYTGTVKVTKDKAGKLTAVKLNTGTFSRTYNVVLDSEGRALGTKMAGKRVQVKGIVEKKSGKTALAVKGFSQIVPKSKTPAPKPAKTTAKTTKTTTTKSTNTAKR